MSRPIWKLHFLLAALCILVGCEGTESSPFNLRGNVTLDDEIIQGVTIQVEDDSGGQAETMTEVRGAYGFEVVPGDKTVSILAGIPGTLSARPASSRM